MIITLIEVEAASFILTARPLQHKWYGVSVRIKYNLGTSVKQLSARAVLS
jgi:hypothetical protein